MQELKERKLPTFGTFNEKKERLKKHYGIGAGGPPVLEKKGSTVEEIEKLRVKREERRKQMEERKRVRTEREIENEQLGIRCDVDFQMLVQQQKARIAERQPQIPALVSKIAVVVRKRPVFKKEAADGEIDCISCTNPGVVVHECKFKVDGVSKYIENHQFQFDNTFGDDESTSSLYECTVGPHVEFMLEQRGTCTCFAYGQTGSGKSFTMQGVQARAVGELFEAAREKSARDGVHIAFSVSYYEIYGGKLYDLLNNHERLNVCEDKNGAVQIQGLREVDVQDEQTLLECIEYGASVRMTQATASNDTSSRSHAICTI